MTTDLSPSGIQRLLEICEKASSGWRSMRDGNQYIGDLIVGASRVEGLLRPWNRHYVVPAEKLEDVSRFVDEDADFIAAARTALPDALREIQRLTLAMATAADQSQTVAEYQDRAIRHMTARIAALEEALKPFAAQADCWDGDADDEAITTCSLGGCASIDFTIGDLRKARAVLTGAIGEARKASE